LNPAYRLKVHGSTRKQVPLDMSMLNSRYKPIQSTGFLARLRRDRRGNTLAIMAGALIPLLGFSGSAVDMARMYLVKSRLQQACDAGTLAGRKAMTDTTLTSSTLDNEALKQANGFFFNNFPNASYGVTDLAFTPTKTSAGGSASANAVNGDASAVVPMAVMQVFGFKNQKVSVTCQSRYDVADTDVLFILDTTGSMACLPADSDSVCSAYAVNANKDDYTRPSDSNGVPGYAGTKAYLVKEKANSRIEALRLAVLSFYDTFAANADKSTKVRYGFVTYASSVNMGRAILDVMPGALAGRTSGDTVQYQSRAVIDDYQISATPETLEAKTETQCTGSTRNPLTPLTYSSNTGTASLKTLRWDAPNKKCYSQTKTLGPKWEYRRLPIDVSAAVAGNVVVNPTKVRGQTMRWLGCVETPVDKPGQSSFNATSLPTEIDPDAKPTGASRWIPHMQDLEYVRNGSYTNNATFATNGDWWEYAPGYGSDAYATYSDGSAADGEGMQLSNAVACGKPVKRLGEMTRSDVKNFVYASDFVAAGGTYHDVGMIWGARLISPDGAWAGDTAAWSGRNAPNRVIVFLTDGAMAPSVSSYSMYGMEGYDRRVGNGSTAQATLTDLHNKRFLAACAGAKAKNIDVWTVAIDDAASPTLESCATTKAQAFFTTSGSDLSNKFVAIAKKLAMLRISK
jgi:Flp pilus assembly protein TadG